MMYELRNNLFCLLKNSFLWETLYYGHFIIYIVFYAFALYPFYYKHYIHALGLFVWIVFPCIVFHALYSMHCFLCIIFYALYSLHWISYSVYLTNVETHCWPTDQQTDQPTNRPTNRPADRRILSHIKSINTFTSIPTIIHTFYNDQNSNLRCI